MAEKSYSQMKQEFIKFYHNEVKLKLPEYNKSRKKDAPRIIAFYATFLSVVALVACALILPNIVVVLFPLPFICAGILFYVSRNHTSNEVEHNLEKNLKYTLMPIFLSIFFNNPGYSKCFANKNKEYDESVLKKITEAGNTIRAQKILNPFPTMSFDDVITGTFKGVKINIIESDTRIFNAVTILLIPFFVVFLSFMTMGLFLVLAAIAAIIFSWKIFQYSVFRGVILEFDIKKNFEGHTFFHEKSLRAAKIPFNHKIFKKVNLESVSFEDKYNVYSDNQVEARYLFTTAFMERVENLKFVFKAKYIRGSFKDNKLFIAIHTGKDMFAMGSDFKDSDVRTFETLYDEMVSVLQVIDVLKLNEYTGL